MFNISILSSTTSVNNSNPSGIPIVNYNSTTSLISSFNLDTTSNTIATNFSNKITITASLKTLIETYGITTISIQDSFNSPCTATITCKINADTYSSLLSTFVNTNKIDLFGIAFRTESFSISEKSNFHKQQYEITINLESWFKQYLDRYITVNNNSFTNSSIEGYKYINISSIARLAGFSIGSCGKYYIDQNNTESISINVGSIISQGLSDTGKFANYANLDNVTIRSWNNGSGFSLDNNSIFEISLNSNYKLKKLEVPVTQLTWLTDIENPENDPSGEDPIGYEPPTFSYNPISTTIIVTPDDNSYLTPFDHHTSIKTFDMNFDISGDVKTKDISTYEGSTLMRKTIDTYGYMFSSTQIPNLETTGFEISPTAYWTKISSITTIYNYSTEGYLISENTTGWRYARFKTESLDDNIVGSDDETEIDLYTFRQLSIQGIKSYTLKTMLGVYSDLGNGIDRYVFYDALNSRGEIIKQYIANPGYIEPFYITQETDYFNSFDWMPNEDPEEHPYTTGEYRNIQKNINILDSTSLRNSSSRSEDRYRVSYIIQNFSDSNFKNFYTERYSEIINGRPPQGLYKNSPYTLSGNGRLIYPSSPEPPDSNINNNSIRCIYTAPYNSNDAISSSKSYNVSNYSLALNAANTELQINNTFSNRSFNINTFFNTSIKSGDTIFINWNTVGYTTIVSSVTHSISIIDSDNIIGYSSINCAELDTTSYTTNTKTIDNPDDPDDPNNPDDPDIFLPPLDPNRTIGGSINFSGVNRGNF